MRRRTRSTAGVQRKAKKMLRQRHTTKATAATKRAPHLDVEGLIAAHTRARHRLAKAEAASRMIPLQHASIDFPEKMGDRAVDSHWAIDEFAKNYIAEAKEKGHWPARHHCTDSSMIGGAPPIDTRKFTPESLKDYRERVKAHHARYEAAAADVEKVNIATGARAAYDHEREARGHVTDALQAFKLALPRMSASDIGRFARYVALYATNDLNASWQLYRAGEVSYLELIDYDCRQALRWISERLRPPHQRRRAA